MYSAGTSTSSIRNIIVMTANSTVIMRPRHCLGSFTGNNLFISSSIFRCYYITWAYDKYRYQFVCGH